MKKSIYLLAFCILFLSNLNAQSRFQSENGVQIYFSESGNKNELSELLNSEKKPAGNFRDQVYLLDSTVSARFDTLLMDVIPGTRRVYVRDDQGAELETTTWTYGISVSDWVPTSKINYTIDPIDQSRINITSNWNSTTQMWELASRNIITYSSVDSFSRSTNQVWNNSLNDWTNSTRTTITTLAAVVINQFEVWENGNWRNFNRRFTESFPDEEYIKITFDTWQVNSQEFVTTQQTFLHYNNDKLVLQDIFTGFGIANLANSIKFEYFYNNEGLQIEALRTNFSLADQAWILHSRSLQEYENGLRIDIVNQIYVPATSQWINNTRITNTYYDFDLVKRTLNLVWNPGILEYDLASFIDHYYGLFNTTGISDEAYNPITLYPNPVNTSLFVKDFSPDFRYKIANVSGAIVRAGFAGNSEINVGDLKPGIYFLIIDDDGKSMISKFIKQ